MALRMMVYQGLLYQDLIRQGAVLSEGRLPPVLPIVLYNGSRRWTAATDVFDLIPPVPGLVEQFRPRAKYLLVDENAYTDGDLASLRNLVAAVFRIEHPTGPETIQGLLGLLEEWLADRPDLQRMIARWIRATLMRKPEYRILLPEVENLQGVRIMLSEQLEVWARQYEAEGLQKGMQQGMQQGMQKGMQQGIQQGMQKGMRQGEALALQKLLTKRFGVIPPDVLARIASASQDQVEEWLDRVLDVLTLDEVFSPLSH